MSPALHSAHIALLNDQSRLPTVAHAFVVAAVIMTKWDRRYKTRKALAKLDDHTSKTWGSPAQLPIRNRASHSGAHSFISQVE